VSQSRSRFELVWQGPSAIPAMEAMGARCHLAGESVQATVDENRLQDALDLLKAKGLRLISVNPVGGSLEEYFMEKLREPETVEART
jgi:hypothetical protein